MPDRRLLLLLCLCACGAQAGERGALRNGVGLDCPLGSHGNLHLTVHERRDPRKRGLRYALRERAEPAARLRWSLGPAVTLRQSAHGERFIGVVPQLRLQLPLAADTVHARIDYGYWGAGRRTTERERVWQAHFSLRF